MSRFDESKRAISMAIKPNSILIKRLKAVHPQGFPAFFLESFISAELYALWMVVRATVLISCIGAATDLPIALCASVS